MILRPFRCRLGDQIGQIPGVYDGKFMKGTGSCHIQKLDICIFRGIVFRSRIIEEHCIELKTFRIFYGEHHDSLGKFGRLRICIGKCQFCTEQLFKIFCLCIVPADHCNCFSAVRLPVSDCLYDFYRHSVRTAALCYAYRVPVTPDRIHRVDGKASVP